MYLFADLVVCNGIDFISAALSRPLAIVDKMVVIDTGSTDGTLEFAQAMAAKFPEQLSVIDHGSIAPDYNISVVRNIGWNYAPPETTWHWNISDDEIYNWEDLPRLREFLTEHENDSARFVHIHFHEYGLNGDHNKRIYSEHDYHRVMIQRWTPKARWIGVWGREAVLYPDGKHTNSPDKDPSDILDPEIYYHHFNWLRKKYSEALKWYDHLRLNGM